MRRYGKVDANHSQVVAALRKLGCSVQSLADIGKGCPDLLVGYHGRNYAFEVKHGKGKLTPDEERWAASWRGQVHTIRSFEEAMKIIVAR